MAQSVAPVAVLSIEGIGPVVAGRLRAAGILDTNDLLLRSVGSTHVLVSDLVSMDQVGRWRDMAELLQIYDMTPQWAEALAAAGVGSADALAFEGLDRIRSVFTAAVSAHTIPEAPDDSTVLGLVRDAMWIRNTGVIVGRLEDETGAAIADATVRFSSASGTSDARGRFRLVRVPLGRTGELYVDRGAQGVAALGSPPIQLDQRVTGEVVLRVDREALTITPLDEFDGDVLPAFNGPPTITELNEATALREGDLLFVSHFYSDGETTRLTSWFRAFTGGKFLIRNYRVRNASLPSGIALRDTVLRGAGSFRPLALSTKAIADYRRDIGFYRWEAAQGIEPSTVGEVVAQINRALQAEV